MQLGLMTAVPEEDEGPHHLIQLISQQILAAGCQRSCESRWKGRRLRRWRENIRYHVR